ncbi:MAG: putative bifunctional diguanylate cyclase/phosphodiesterase [Candidatus Limnocylindria bacterium]
MGRWQDRPARDVRWLGPSLDVALAVALAVGMVAAPLGFAHLVAVVLVVQAFVLDARGAIARLAAATLLTLGASGLHDVPAAEVAVQVPFVYGIAGLVITLATSLRRSRATAERAYHEAERLARFDPLTGLPNRIRFNEQVDVALGGQERPVALLLMDLDHFKEINDTFGHQAGDAVLGEVGRRLTDALGPDEAVARLGGDEFALVLPGAGPEEARARAERLLHALLRPISLDGQPLAIGGSIGIAVSPDHGTDPGMLLRHADVALYEAKATSGTAALYRPDRDANGSDRLRLAAELSEAIERSQLALHYQPQVDARTGEVRSLEALLRWRHPERGDVPPGEFVPLAERSGLVLRLTEHVLATALEQSRAWREAGLSLPIAVNLSVRNVSDRRLPQVVRRLLEQTGSRPRDLVLEITESSLMRDQESTCEVIAVLRAMGVRLSIDDFGSGYSSIAYLDRLGADEVKIDRSFVSGLLDEGSSAAIVRAIIDFGHALDFEVVAEGVESAEVWRRLVSLGCDRIQGYHVARPMPPIEVPRWIHTWSVQRTDRAS